MCDSKMEPEDCVYYADGEKIKSSGFEIDPMLFSKSVCDLTIFKDLGIPIGLHYNKKNNNKRNQKSCNLCEVANCTLYDKLVDLVQKKKKGSTKKKRGLKSTNRKTKRMK